MDTFVMYKHHGKAVWVKEHLRGKHRDHCLCHSCAIFKPDDREMNCLIADVLYSIDVALHLTTPVWECPFFVPHEKTEEE